MIQYKNNVRSVLLIGEASGVHAALKDGLLQHGVTVRHVTQYDAHQGRTSDGRLASARRGILGQVIRNVEPYIKIAAFPKYDVISFLNSISAVHGTVTRYHDLPLIKRKARLLSYYAVGCDEIGIVKKHPSLDYAPCAGCAQDSADLYNACRSLLEPRYNRSLHDVKTHFDFAACSMCEYEHVSTAFKTVAVPIALPINIGKVAFHPAKSEGTTRIVHAPTRRGYKGTPIIIEAMKALSERRSDFEFKIVENLSHADFLATMRDADIVVDQIYSQSAGIAALEMMASGKVVFTGATKKGVDYNPAFQHSPAFDASPEPRKLADSLSHVLDMKDSFPTLAEKGRSYVTAYHSPSTIGRQFIESWNQALMIKAGSL